MLSRLLLICAIAMFSACEQSAGTKVSSTSVRDSVHQMMTRLSRDISQKGPTAWLQYFEDKPGFFMASEGAMSFPNYDSAARFINNTLSKQVRHMKLEWRDVRVDVVNDNLAAVGANWLENMTDSTGETHLQSGYFTGVAEATANGWKLRNAHWSAISPVD
jgi:SnoaL-like domain